MPVSQSKTHAANLVKALEPFFDGAGQAEVSRRLDSLSD